MIPPPSHNLSGWKGRVQWSAAPDARGSLCCVNFIHIWRRALNYKIANLRSRGRGGWGGGLLLCVSPLRGRGERGGPCYNAEEEGEKGLGQVQRGECGDTTPPTAQRSLPTAQEFKGSFEPLKSPPPLPSPPPATWRCFFCVEISEMRFSLCFGPNMPILWHEGGLPTPTGLPTKITPPCLLCFLLHPLQHMTCVTATDLLYKIRPVEGQGKSPKQRAQRGKKVLIPLPFFFFFTLMDYLKSSFFLNA